MRNAMDAAYNTAAWCASFFQASSTDPQKLPLCKTDFFLQDNRFSQPASLTPDEKNLFQYLMDKRFLKDGYTEVIFYNFDFSRVTEEEKILCDLLLHVDQHFTFIQTTFTFPQIDNLLRMPNVTLEKSIYNTQYQASFEEYSRLFHYCLEQEKIAGLHGIRVDFSKADLTTLPEDIVAACQPISLKNTRITSVQLQKFLIQHPQDERLRDEAILCDPREAWPSPLKNTPGPVW